MIPTTLPHNLSEGAYRLYRNAAADDRAMTVKGDNQMDLATEIAKAGLGTLRISNKYDSTLSVTRFAKGFSVARNIDAADHSGYFYIEVEVLRKASDRDGFLVAALYGARFSKSGSGSPWPVWNAEVRDFTVKDSGHSSAYLATLDFHNPVLDSAYGTETTFKAMLSDIRMWPTGTDISLIDTHSSTGEPLTEPEMCTYGHCEKNPHPFGPYQPVHRDDLNTHIGRAVKITITPITNVTENGLHVTEKTITRDDEDDD